jgi:TRAP-type mannitol/chloroaromatic compound transport system permease small subunit
VTEIAKPEFTRPCKGWVDQVTRALGEKASFVFLLAVALTFYEVVLRYFFNAPTTWVHEVSIFLTASAFIIGGSYTLQRRDHIRITLIFDAAPPRVRYWLSIVNATIALYFLMALGYGAALQAEKSLKVMETTGTASDLPLPVTLKSLLTLGVALMILQAAVQLGRAVRNRL